MQCPAVQSVRESECFGTDSANSKLFQSWQIDFYIPHRNLIVDTFSDSDLHI